MIHMPMPMIPIMAMEDAEDDCKTPKVGDTVYSVKKASYCPSGVCHSKRTCSECRALSPFRVYRRRFHPEMTPEIGKSVFLTEKEAQKKAQELNKSLMKGE